MIIDGKKLADEILRQLKKEIQKLPRRLSIGAVLVGRNPASMSFLKQKERAAEMLGINFKIFKFPPKTATARIRGKALELNKIRNINGIIIQLPLPKHINTEKNLAVINPNKDIDALSKSPLILAPTVEAIKFIFQKYRINLRNKNILIVGRGRLVGQPIYNWLVSQETSRQVMMLKKIWIVDIKQKNQLPKIAREADIIISGVGKAGLIKGNMIKKDAVLIDFGFSKKNGKIFGDFDFNSCATKAKFITPVPGGMGPIMIAMIFKNLLNLETKDPSYNQDLLFQGLH